ncbi:hypothetical protein H6B33_12100 [Gemmiger formicilis]|uniref:hypothetical protein n=1 Tax=Gemmiger formicilis TaxID=745368 RepID=UPI0019588E56|nr:hypothetical protein [Gemmiger formicilis]MBM6916136.1 hypothetical protein [Gemmiger formicilis]
MGSLDLQKLVRAKHMATAEKLKGEIEDWKRLIGVLEKQLKVSTKMFEKYGDETSKKFMESDAENLIFVKKMLAEDRKLLDAYEAEL